MKSSEPNGDGEWPEPTRLVVQGGGYVEIRPPGGAPGYCMALPPGCSLDPGSALEDQAWNLHIRSAADETAAVLVALEAGWTLMEEEPQ